MKRPIILASVFVILLSGCGLHILHKESLDLEKPSAEVLFILGCSYLGSCKFSPNYTNARLCFQRICDEFPESKWRIASEGILSLIDRVEQLAEENQQLKAEIESLTKEIEQNKTLIRELKTETSILKKKNAILRKDIERLKQLEIELEKRKERLKSQTLKK